MNQLEVIALCGTVIALVTIFAVMYHHDAQRDCDEFPDDLARLRKSERDRAALARCVHCGGRIDGGAS